MDAGPPLQPDKDQRSLWGMSEAKILRVYLHHPILQTARAGKLGFLNRLSSVLVPQDWEIMILPSGQDARVAAPDLPGYALFHMERPTHARALTFRLAYHYPFWRIERDAERWRWPVSRAAFLPDLVDVAAAEDFASRLRQRVLPGGPVTAGDFALIPLQGLLRVQRSFQTMSPVDMVEAVAATGRACIATLHPKEQYDPADHAALFALAQRYPNLTIGGNSDELLRRCAYVVTQNSAVAFDGFILGKPAVLFAQVDFHHIALNVGNLGADEAMTRAMTHRPPFAQYLDWFLRQNSLDMASTDVTSQMHSALHRFGWPV